MKKFLAVILAILLLASAGVASAAPAIKFAYKPKGFAFDRCGYESGLKGAAAKLQDYLLSNRNCIGPLKIVESKLVSEKPKIKSSSTGMLATELCKLESPSSAQNNVWKGFPSLSRTEEFESSRVPAPGKTIQIIPIYSSDAPKSGKTPYQDYKYYIDATRQYFNYINDGLLPVNVVVPDEYILFPKPLAPYRVQHGKDDALSKVFIQDAITAVDSEIDFSKSDFRLFVVPAGTPSSVISEQGFPGGMSAEGRVNDVAIAQPATFTTAENNRIGSGLASLVMYFHEFYHPGMNLGDNHAGNSRSYDDERGMGQFGMMSSGNGDLLAWQKWFLGFMQDSQIRCVDSKSKSISWIAPSSVKTKMSKMVVVPISNTKALIVESIRAKGLSYRYPSSSLGALVYQIDLSDSRHDYGYTVMYPDNRRPKQDARYPMHDAPLKVGESLTFEGVKITNVEWGEFGDVIKVEPVK